MLDGRSSDKTWVVSDLTSKIAFQNELFKEMDIIPDESLLRAQELWLILIKRLRGDLKIISSETAQIYARQILSRSEVEWHQRPGVSQLVLGYLHILIPILSHDENSEAIKDFFTKNIESYNKWGHWYLLAKEIFETFKEDKFIIPTWASSILVNEDGFSDVWNRKIIFDLAAQLQPIESELILTLSKHLDVEVIVPHPSWKEEYSKALKSYELLISGKTPKLEGESPSPFAHNYHKFTTQLAEIQDACALVRKNIESGIEPKKIAVCAPDIGVYWPVLSEYLKTEGIPYQRKIQTPLKTFPEILNWLSRLKVEAGHLEFSDLEARVFSDTSDMDAVNSDPVIDYANFHSLYINLYDDQDIKRSTKVSNLFRLEHHEKTIGLQEFISWSLKFWKESWDQDRLTLLIDKLYSDVPMRLKFDLKTWLSLAESFAAKLEITTDEGYQEGLYCIDLVSLKDLDVKCVYMLGLTDQALRSISTTLISESDIERLKMDYGFIIAEPERTELEFEVLWNLENPDTKLTLSYPQTNFDGDQMSPSIVWFKGAAEKHNNSEIPIRLAAPSRMMQIQGASFETIAELRSWEAFEGKQRRINEDLGGEPAKWGLSNHVDKISASQVEDYLNCPFINASKKIFCLVDLPDIDLDIDYLTRGRLLHGVAEAIYREYPNLDIEKHKIPEIFEKVRAELETPVFDKNIWDGQRIKYIKMIENFIEFEKEWRARFPVIQKVMHEQEFSVFVEVDTGKIVTKKSDKSIELRGRIDRVEVDEKESVCVVVDYKFSSDSYSNHDKWLEKNELQLALYSMAIEAGALKRSYEVVGAVYYGFKNLNRNKGMLVMGAEDGMFELSNRGKSKIDLNKKSEVYQAVSETIKAAMASMQAGDYNPAPKDVKNCSSCHWRTLCRAPHLN